MIPAQTIAQMGKSSLKEKTNMMKALPMMSMLGGGGMGQGFTGAGGGMSAPVDISNPANPGPGFATPPGGSVLPPGSFTPPGDLGNVFPPTTDLTSLGGAGGDLGSLGTSWLDLLGQIDPADVVQEGVN